MKEISPGKIYILWELMGILSRQQLTDVNPADLVKVLDNNAFPSGNLSLIKDTIDEGLALQLFSFNSGRLFLSDGAASQYTPLLSQEDGLILFIREILYKIITSEKPHWVIFFDFDASLFCEYIPATWVDVLQAGALLNFENADVIIWWENIIIELQRAENIRKEEIGRIGEILTVEYEKNRLSSEGHQNINHLVKWASKISDRYGYDVRSIYGNALNPQKSHEHIQIEVKSSQSSDSSNFRFYVTRNEWETAIKSPDSYFFYCWIGVSIQERSSKAGPFILPARDIVDWFPVDKVPECRWTECQILIDVNIYCLTSILNID